MLDARPPQFQSGSNSTSKIFGILGLVFGSFSLIFSLIPCVGFYAIVPAFISLVFCIVSYVPAKREQQPTTVPLIGMIVAVMALVIGIIQYVQYKDVFKAASELNRAVDSVMVKKVVDSVDAAIEKDIREDSINKVQKDSVW